MSLTNDGRRLQRIDSLLRQEPIDSLRELLSRSEAELEAKNSSVVELIGDAYPEVLHCATAISRIHAHCVELVATSNDLKPLQSKLQDVLLAAGPTHGPAWEIGGQLQPAGQGEHEQIEIDGLSFAQWLTVDPSLWEALVQKHRKQIISKGQPPQHPVKILDHASAVVARGTRERRIKRLLLRAYSELPRLILEMLSHSKPLQALCLLTGWGPLLRQSLLALCDGSPSMDTDHWNQRDQHMISILLRQKSYFSCYDLLNRTKLSAHEALVNPIPPRWLANRPTSLSLSCLELLPPRCCCPSCQPLLQSYSFQGTGGMLEVLTTIMVLDPNHQATLHAEVFDTRTQLVQRLLQFDLTDLCHTVSEWNGECELLKTCFVDVDPSVLTFNMSKLMEVGYRLSCALRVLEVTVDGLWVLESGNGSILQKEISQFFKLIGNDSTAEGLDACLCYLCRAEQQKPQQQPVVHVWNDCSHSPVVTEDMQNSVQPIMHRRAEALISALQPGILNTISEIIQIVTAGSGIQSPFVINGFWRLIYSLVLTDRLWALKQLPFQRPSRMTLSYRSDQLHHASLKTLLDDPGSLKTCIAGIQRFWIDSKVHCALRDASRPSIMTDGLLESVASVFDTALDKVLERETKRVLSDHLNDVLFQRELSLERFNQLELEVGLLVVSTERILSTPCSWYRLYTNPSFIPTFRDGGEDDGVPSKSLASVVQRLVNCSTLLPKAQIIKSYLSESLVNAIHCWFTQALESDKDHGLQVDWGGAGWTLSFISETLTDASDASKISAQYSGLQRFSLPFLSWIFRIPSLRTTTTAVSTGPFDVSAISSSIRQIADAALYRWALMVLHNEVESLCSDVHDAHIIDEESETVSMWDPVRMTAMGWKALPLTSFHESGSTSSWCIPCHPRPTLSLLVFHASQQLVSLHQHQVTFGRSNAVVQSVVECCRQAMAMAIIHLVYHSYTSATKVRRPCFTATVQMLFDLEWLDVLLTGKGLLKEIRNCDQLVPPYLKDIWTSSHIASLSQLQSRIREECLMEDVDRMLYSSNNLRPIALESLETQVLLVAPLASMNEVSGPVADLQAQWKSKRLLGRICEAQAPVAPLTPRLQLLPVSSSKTKNLPSLPPSEFLARSTPVTTVARLPSTSSVALDSSGVSRTTAAVDYTVSAAAALREMKDGLLKSNVAVDLGSSVSNLSSFFRGMMG